MSIYNNSSFKYNTNSIVNISPTITATNYSIQGTLPEGLTFNSETGAITGTVTQQVDDSTTVTVSASEITQELTFIPYYPGKGYLYYFYEYYITELPFTIRSTEDIESVSYTELPEGVQIHQDSIEITKIPNGGFTFYINLYNDQIKLHQHIKIIKYNPNLYIQKEYNSIFTWSSKIQNRISLSEDDYISIGNSAPSFYNVNAIITQTPIISLTPKCSKVDISISVDKSLDPIILTCPKYIINEYNTDNISISCHVLDKTTNEIIISAEDSISDIMDLWNSYNDNKLYITNENCMRLFHENSVRGTNNINMDFAAGLYTYKDYTETYECNISLSRIQVEGHIYNDVYAVSSFLESGPPRIHPNKDSEGNYSYIYTNNDQYPSILGLYLFNSNSVSTDATISLSRTITEYVPFKYTTSNYSYTVDDTVNISPEQIDYNLQYTMIDELPPGLTLNPATGSISGSPTATGNYTVFISTTHDASYGQILKFNIHQGEIKHVKLDYHNEIPYFIKVIHVTKGQSITINKDNFIVKDSAGVSPCSIICNSVPEGLTWINNELTGVVNESCYVTFTVSNGDDTKEYKVYFIITN